MDSFYLNKKKTIIIILGIVYLIYQIVPFYVEEENKTINHEISSKCYYNNDYINFPRYETERDECLNYINKAINKNYRPYNYFGAFEKK